MEDLDPPREEAGAADAILHSLQQHGLHWDEEVLWQNTRQSAYAACLDELTAQGHLFNCTCSRAEQSPAGTCDGSCSSHQQETITPHAIRIGVPATTTIKFSDVLQGLQTCHLGQLAADFIVKRKDGLDAYQLAVVVDDAAQGITHIVRGSDLLEPTARQIFLQQTLGCATPSYCHLPVITTAQGQKFSKQNHAPALDNQAAAANLRLALRFLNQIEPPSHSDDTLQLLTHAIEHWRLDRVPAQMAIAASELGLKQ